MESEALKKYKEKEAQRVAINMKHLENGAYFSGIASGSLHGWLWLVFAFIGNGIGVKLRPIFFPEEKPQAEKITGC